MWQHRNAIAEGFTKKYNIHTLVYYEFWDDMESAIIREKKMKKWRRAWKIELVEKLNPAWRDLWQDLE